MEIQTIIPLRNKEIPCSHLEGRDIIYAIAAAGWRESIWATQQLTEKA